MKLGANTKIETIYDFLDESGYPYLSYDEEYQEKQFEVDYNGLKCIVARSNNMDADDLTPNTFSYFIKVGGRVINNSAKDVPKILDYLKSRYAEGGLTMKAPKLLAPNGKKSNLNEVQYHLVRTPAFKAWFGDWENSPETASKVVDKNGEPLPVYHGSPNNDIKKFKPNYDGIFFSDKLEVASSVSGSELITENKITKAEKKILDKEYDDIYDYNFLFNDLKKIGYKIDISRKEFTDKYGNTELNNVAEITNLYGEKQIHKLDYFRVDWQKRGIILRGRNYQVFLNIRNPIIVNAKGSEWDNIEYEDKIINSGDIGVLAQKNKNDGSIIKNLVEYYIISDVFLVFNSNQIKLADGTNTTFDSNNPDIRYNNGGLTMKAPKLLAPNGKPSNLTPEQYKLVRTPAFKAWFGDWENSPETASKVVDENGEPLVLWHGSYLKFDVFKNTGDKNYFTGFHFGNEQASIDAFENKRQKFYDMWEMVEWDDLTSYEKKKFRNGEFEFDNPKYYEVFLNIRKIKKTNDVGDKYWASEIKKAKKDKYDGILYKNDIESVGSYSYIAFYPNQIKLADGTNTTFDSNNPDIRYNNGGLTIKEPKLLAPNGKPSNLTPEQYRLVRTPAFKKWFGDWEKAYRIAITQNRDAEYTLIKGNKLWGWKQNNEIIYLNHSAYKNISKVLDDNGEPLIVHHGTKSNFNVFNLGNVSNRDWKNIKDAQFRSGADPTAFVGSHFSKEHSVARAFIVEKKYKKIKGSIASELIEKEVGSIKSCFLNIKNIFLYDKLNRPIDEYDWQKDMQSQYVSDIKKYIGSIDLQNDLFVDNYREFITNYNESYEFRQTTHTLIMSVGNILSIRLAERLGIMYRNMISIKYEGEYFYPKNKKYDGIVYRNYWEGGTSYCVWDATQIKLADGTNTTFDSNNPDIRFVKGGSVVGKEINTLSSKDSGSISDLLSSQEVEDKLGRKLDSWNDNTIEIEGKLYKKVYLRPEYKLI